MKKAMRRYTPPTLTCTRCGGPVRSTASGFEHVNRVGITDPAWHVAVVR
jgi:hypothetical protein